VRAKKIQDELVRLETQRRCTKGAPCAIDQAPSWRVMREDRDRVNEVTYPGVSCFSYLGWCQTLQPVSWQVNVGSWADCTAAPCKRNANTPDRPWTCQCRFQPVPISTRRLRRHQRPLRQPSGSGDVDIRAAALEIQYRYLLGAAAGP
jgi:hypothetical protein